MILHVNPVIEPYHDSAGTADMPFSSVRQAHDFINEHKLIDWRIRYYYEEITAWIFLH